MGIQSNQPIKAGMCHENGTILVLLVAVSSLIMGDGDRKPSSGVPDTSGGLWEDTGPRSPEPFGVRNGRLWLIW